MQLPSMSLQQHNVALLSITIEKLPRAALPALTRMAKQHRAHLAAMLMPMLAQQQQIQHPSLEGRPARSLGMSQQ